MGHARLACLETFSPGASTLVVSNTGPMKGRLGGMTVTAGGPLDAAKLGAKAPCGTPQGCCIGMGGMPYPAVAGGGGGIPQPAEALAGGWCIQGGPAGGPPAAAICGSSQGGGGAANAGGMAQGPGGGAAHSGGPCCCMGGGSMPGPQPAAGPGA